MQYIFDIFLKKETHYFIVRIFVKTGLTACPGGILFRRASSTSCDPP